MCLFRALPCPVLHIGVCLPFDCSHCCVQEGQVEKFSIQEGSTQVETLYFKAPQVCPRWSGRHPHRLSFVLTLSIAGGLCQQRICFHVLFMDDCTGVPSRLNPHFTQPGCPRCCLFVRWLYCEVAANGQELGTPLSALSPHASRTKHGPPIHGRATHVWTDENH